MKVRSSETRSLSREFDVLSSKAQVPSFEAQFNRIFRVTFFSCKKAGIKQGRIGAARCRHRKKAGRSPSQEQSIFPKLPKPVLVVNLGSRFDLTAFVLEKPLLWENLRQDPVLKTFAVIRQLNATNYKITQHEWQRVHELRNSFRF